jgi:hypothetical protein
LRAKPQPERSSVSDDEIRSLLRRYSCPVPFHAVRTRFLGSIAAPDLSAAPLDTAKALWGGELPEFESLDAVNELLRVLIMGLWNRLARHQDRRSPFRLQRTDLATTPEDVARVALIRAEELEGFIDGLFGTADRLDLPERAHRGVQILGEVRGFLVAMRELAVHPATPGSSTDLAETVGNIRKLTRVAEHEIHEVVLSCTRARRQLRM